MHLSIAGGGATLSYVWLVKLQQISPFLQSCPSKMSSALEKADTPPKKRCSTQQHMTYDVVEEVIRLLGRMEEDRLSTQEMLVTERQRVNHLRSQIDDLAFKRLLDLPAAVQKGMDTFWFKI